MNSKIKIRLAIVAFSVLAISCTSVNTVTREVKSVQIPSEPVIQKPLVGELKVDKEKVKVMITARKNENKSLYMLKQEALTKAVKETGADVIIEPQFDVVSKNGFVEAVYLQGFPAKYARFRPIEETDTVWTKNGLLRPEIGVVSNQKTSEVVAKKSSKAGVVLGTIGGVLLIALCFIPLLLL